MAENPTPDSPRSHAAPQPEPATAPAAPAKSKAKEEKEKPYTIGSWRGMEMLQCNECPWNTIDGEESMDSHIRGAHTIIPPPSPLVLPVRRDRFGDEVK